MNEIGSTETPKTTVEVSRNDLNALRAFVSDAERFFKASRPFLASIDKGSKAEDLPSQQFEASLFECKNVLGKITNP